MEVIHDTKFNTAHCSNCRNVYRYKRKQEAWPVEYIEPNTLMCPRCAKLHKRRRNLDAKALEIDWILFTLRHHPGYLDD